MHSSTLRPDAPPFYPHAHSHTHTQIKPHTPYISAVEPYHHHPVTYVQIGPHQHVPLYIYHQVRGIFINEHFQAQQEQYFYSHVPPPPPPQPVVPVDYEWWLGDEGERAWVDYGGGAYEVDGYGYGENGYAGQQNRRYKYVKQGKKGRKVKKCWGFKGKKRGERDGEEKTRRENGSATAEE